RGHHHHRKPITVKVSPHFFGVHDTSLASLTHRGIGALRLWDAGVMWRDLEPQPGVYDFARLDHIVELAHADHTEVTLVLAGTPAWAAANPQANTWIDPPKVSAYQSFVTTVMKRYKKFDPSHTGHGYRGIANYQVWNEPNIKTYWTGTQPQMATLVHTAWEVRQKVDKGAKIIAPSMVTRLPYELKAIGKFYRLKVAHKPVWKFVDAMTFSLYPVDVIKGRPAGPEDMMTLVNATRKTLTKAHVPTRLPMWDSEVNYGLPSGSNVGKPTPPISGGRQAAYVMRTYLLSAAAGLPRVFWYRYDFSGVFANTFLTAPAPAPVGTLTTAGQAFFRIQQWMKGTLVGTPTKRPCAADKHGTYTCVVKYGKGMGRIYWNPRHTVKVKTVKSSKSWQSELGTVHHLKHGAKIKVGYAPVLVLSKH
ncbi:MAG TPA: beta-galactosidase, partial [Nocardioides sp.]|nr:beta-galactosidase [Nocardioides sp.]